MNLIAVFRGFDGIIGQELLDNEEIEISGATIKGNRITIRGTNGDGQRGVVAHADLEVHGKTALWHLFKGARGKEIGIATEVEFYI